MKTFLRMLVACIVATFMAGVLIMHGASDNAVISVFLFGGVGLCLVLGVFDVKKRKDVKHTSIKDATRNYGQAAVFIGTACLFIGTQTECDERADDLWHYGVQAEVRELTGDETFEIL